MDKEPWPSQLESVGAFRAVRSVPHYGIIMHAARSSPKTKMRALAAFVGHACRAAFLNAATSSGEWPIVTIFEIEIRHFASPRTRIDPKGKTFQISAGIEAFALGAQSEPEFSA
jgi:hypothetical protein